METHALSSEILALIPHGPGFRFIDRITEVSENHIVGQYTFDVNAPFYPHHFPGNPVTPGVILIETMAQTAVVAHGIFLLISTLANQPTENPKDYLTMFTECNAEFHKEVPPGETVTVRGERIYWRLKKLRSKASLYLSNGELAATATLSGIGVKRQ